MLKSSSRRILPQLQNPFPVSYKVACHFGELDSFERDVFARSTGQDTFAAVSQFTFCFEYLSAPIRAQFRDNAYGLPGSQRMHETHIQFSTKTKLSGLNRTRPDHRFIEDRCNEPAMNRVAKARMLVARYESAPDHSSVSLEPQVQSKRVGFTAHEARPCMRQLFHGEKIRATPLEINPKW